MAHVPRQFGASSLGALGSAVFPVRTADKRGTALAPSAGEKSSTMGGSSLGFFSGMSSSRSRSWNSLAICLHLSLCPPSFQSTTWHALEQ
eukprot:CAMPEP_0184112596 /NCGR_PEP_ID=MMETSP0974-20121125/18489_1 /TAXON_ID=483370 /ORGANISM="non described non described, Strain CCMP2097" /LENGTH=89 /DNA_ID=CAMNT_0026415679 /DNA_START=510 /DNA_END=779 /DNA_ORIENTATION=+